MNVVGGNYRIRDNGMKERALWKESLRLFLLLLFSFLIQSPVNGDQIAEKMGYATEASSAHVEGRKDSIHFKKDGKKWLTIRKQFDGLEIRGEASIPAKEIMASENSGLFLPYSAYPVGSWPEAVAIGDLNNDRRNDVVMTTSDYFDPDNDYHIFVFLQNAFGGLEQPIKYSAGNGQSIDIGDLNNDGRADILVTAENSVGVFIQNYSGTFDPMVTYPSNHSSHSNTYKVRVGDLNNDGLDDAVSIDWGTQSHDVDVFLQNTNGTLDSPTSYTVLHGGYDDLEVGDVNNDGLEDIIVMSGQSVFPNIGLLYQSPDGGFVLPVYYDLGGTELTNGIAVGDINNDGLEDIAVTYGGNRPSSHLATFLQNISGTLDPATSYSSYDIPEPVEIADVNSDGKKDVILVHGGWNAMGVYLQDNSGTLLPYELYPIPYASHYNPHGLAVGDLNGDGLNDVAIADYNHGLVVLYHTFPVMSFASYLVDDDNFDKSSGNANRRINPGETIELYVTLRNTGLWQATGVSAVLSTNDPFVTFPDGATSGYPDILAGGTEENLDAFVFAVEPTCPIGHTIEFDLAISSNEGSWADSFQARVVGNLNIPMMFLLLLDNN